MSSQQKIAVYLTADANAKFGSFYNKFSVAIPPGGFGPEGGLVVMCKSVAIENGFVSVTLDTKDGTPWTCRIPKELIALIVDAPLPERKVGFV